LVLLRPVFLNEEDRPLFRRLTFATVDNALLIAACGIFTILEE
jgi:hypothetical protein